MKYFTSDTHLAHPFVAALRGFIRPEYQEYSANDLRRMVRDPDYDLTWEQCVNTAEHDALVVANINRVVTEADELYILGDLSSGGATSFQEALTHLQQLNVPRRRRHLILGNHDDVDKRKSNAEALLRVFRDFAGMGATTIAGRHNVILSHFQFQHHFAEQCDGLAANACSKKYATNAPLDDGSTLLLHGHTHAKERFEFGNYRELNVGVDANNFMPVSETQVLKYFCEAYKELKNSAE